MKEDLNIMKKRFILILVLFPLIGGCVSPINSSLNSKISESSSSNYDKLERMDYFRTKYPIYVEDTNKKILYYGTYDVYCWQNNDDEWYSGIDHYARSSLSNSAPFLIMRDEYPCPLAEMTELLSLFYDITDPNLIVKELNYPVGGKYIPQYFPSTNKFLYDQLNLKASYVYHILRDWESQYPIPLS